MLDMKLNSGKFVIDDDNKTEVDNVMAEKILEGFEENEDNKNKNKPDFTVKD